MPSLKREVRKQKWYSKSLEKVFEPFPLTGGKKEGIKFLHAFTTNFFKTTMNVFLDQDVREVLGAIPPPLRKNWSSFARMTLTASETTGPDIYQSLLEADFLI